MTIAKSLYFGSKKNAHGKFKHRRHHKPPRVKRSIPNMRGGDIPLTGHRKIAFVKKTEALRIKELDEEMKGLTV